MSELTEKKEEFLQGNIIDQPHSVEISINAKCMLSGKVKCYGLTPEEAWTRTHDYTRKVMDFIKMKNDGM